MASTDCGWCGRLVHMRAVSGLLRAPDGWDHNGWVQAAYQCPNCKRLSIATEPGNERFREGDTSDAQQYSWGPLIKWVPQETDQQEFPDVPDHIASAATEATLCLSVGAYRAVGSLARAVIEAIAKDKTASGSNLHMRIEALANAQHIRLHTKEQAHEVRHFGNDMAHGDFTKLTTEEEASEVIELMSEVLNEVYQSPARLAKVRAAREARDADR